MQRFTRPHFSALSYYSNISFMFSAGLLVLVVVLLFITYDEGRERIKKFVMTFALLLKIRKSLTPKVKVKQVDKEVGKELGDLFDL
jgi:hypothetical protein